MIHQEHSIKKKANSSNWLFRFTRATKEVSMFQYLIVTSLRTMETTQSMLISFLEWISLSGWCSRVSSWCLEYCITTQFSRATRSGTVKCQWECTRPRLSSTTSAMTLLICSSDRETSRWSPSPLLRTSRAKALMTGRVFQTKSRRVSRNNKRVWLLRERMLKKLPQLDTKLLSIPTLLQPLSIENSTSSTRSLPIQELAIMEDAREFEIT